MFAHPLGEMKHVVKWKDQWQEPHMTPLLALPQGAYILGNSSLGKKEPSMMTSSFKTVVLNRWIMTPMGVK